ncbi:hypothetical protein [Pseudaminobacter sp. NGMCC 1.201702]|uniref:hypothetical protein n=1 Tax=Pseudaminobacter sp. NGMCC 1.201702 TaxID=3391825 RepID=UPI0039EF028B
MKQVLEAARPPRELVWNEYHDEQGLPDRWDAETPCVRRCAAFLTDAPAHDVELDPVYNGDNGHD